MGWIERAFEEIDEQLECGEISESEHRQATREIKAEAEQEADDARDDYLDY